MTPAAHNIAEHLAWSGLPLHDRDTLATYVTSLRLSAAVFGAEWAAILARAANIRLNPQDMRMIEARAA